MSRHSLLESDVGSSLYRRKRYLVNDLVVVHPVFILICCTRVPPLYGKQHLTARADPSPGSKAVTTASPASSRPITHTCVKGS
ncbi:hypothetical protein LZ31DRAFT_246571 [Colletotrichum somersetense]|nr:hypothetical protein LZ31DRAFT_246571 [Colletotrichum somersetense]